jgi:hypothetical protein
MERAGSEPVPGCTGVTAARSGIDFCYDPNKDENAKPIPASPVQSPTPAPVQPRPVPSPTVSAPVGAEGTTATGNCRQEQLDFSTCLTGKPLCRQCFAPILGQQLNCISLQEEVCTVLATDACECDRCSGVFKKYYDCVSDNVCSALTCDAGTIIDVPVAPTPTRAPVLPNSPTSSPVPEHDYKGSTMLKDVGDNEELTEKLGRCEGDWYVTPKNVLDVLFFFSFSISIFVVFFFCFFSVIPTMTATRIWFASNAHYQNRP